MQKYKLKILKNTIKQYKTIKKELESGHNFLDIRRYECTLNNGKIITREQIIKNNGDGSAAIIVAVTTNNEILVSIEPRIFTKSTVGVDLPAGYIEDSEDATKAGIRELLEETGYYTENIIKLGSFYQDQGCSAAYNYYFLALNCKKIKEQNLDKDEYITNMTFTFDELDYLIENHYMEGLNSVLAVNLAKQYLRK